jgi:hypothetical protein
MPVLHKFVSTIPDAADTTLVRPVNWNDQHAVSIASTAEAPIAAAAILAAAQLNGAL